MTEIDINGNTKSTNAPALRAKVKRQAAPVRHSIQRPFMRVRVALPQGGIITFFADEELGLTEWLETHGEFVFDL
jgi:hypothetical protein